MNNDEFMARLLKLWPISADRKSALEAIGRSYLDVVREAPRMERVLSIANYEDGGLEKIFGAFLTDPALEQPHAAGLLGISCWSTSGSTAIPNRAMAPSAGISRPTTGSCRYGRPSIKSSFKRFPI